MKAKFSLSDIEKDCQEYVLTKEQCRSVRDESEKRAKWRKKRKLEINKIDADYKNKFDIINKPFEEEKNAALSEYKKRLSDIERRQCIALTDINVERKKRRKLIINDAIAIIDRKEAKVKNLMKRELKILERLYLNGNARWVVGLFYLDDPPWFSKDAKAKIITLDVNLIIPAKSDELPSGCKLHT